MLLALVTWPLVRGMAAEVNETPEEIVVTGRLPGPPLWKVSNGERVLWIFPSLDWIPKDMDWDSERVGRIIAESQEVLNPPQSGWGGSRKLWLNPINLMRVERLNSRVERNPDGGTLEEYLPPELYARFAALQARYFPGAEFLADVRPVVAGRVMMNIIQQREGLVRGDDILKTIRRLVSRNRDIKHTEISEITIIDSYGELADRYEALYESYSREQELDCFEQQVRHMEEDLDEMKGRANSWAQGYIDEFRNIPLVFDESDVCHDGLWMDSSSPEREVMLGMKTRVNQMWLEAAENALATNRSTFAILPAKELLAEDGLLGRLKAKGYDVREP